jgi:hypothetical protein
MYGRACSVDEPDKSASEPRLQRSNSNVAERWNK